MKKIIVTILWLGVMHFHALAQCGPSVPSFVVNLSSDPNGTYVSPDTIRNGYCCGATGAVRCVEFVVTLHPDAEGVLFEIFSGAVPGGALFYQINCGPVQNVGTPICLSGTGPHLITFCKPGNNLNQYRITSIAEPLAPDSIFVNDGCTGVLGSAGYEPSSISWNTIFPGPRGAFNSYLSCTAGCDTTYVTAQAGYPPYVDVEICGYPFGGCDMMYTCDTTRIKFFSTLDVEINPLNPTICFGSIGTTITAVPSGGSPPYNYRWSTGATTQSIFVDTGTYIVELGDTSACPPTYDTVVVTAFSLPISANAGSDFDACRAQPQTTLSGSVVAASGGQWIGAGTFFPSPDSLNTTYTPTAAELLAGQAIITLVTTGNGSCPPDSDRVTITYRDFTGAIETGSIPVSCFGGSDGTAIATATGTSPPYTILWDAATGNQTGDTAFMLPAGNYVATISDSLGCLIDTIVEVIQADSILTLNIDATPITCFGDANGMVTVTPAGGTSPYQYTWDPLLGAGNTPVLNGLAAGTFTLAVTDAFGCVIDTFFTIIGPVAPLGLTFNVTNVSCQDGSDGAITALPTGGLSPYSYQWDAGTGSQTTATVSGLPIGTYAVTVTDSLGCTISDTTSVIEPPSTIVYNDTTTSPSCTGGNDGTATVFPAGGTPPYTFLWDSLAGYQTTQTATGLSAGFYTVTIFDANSCLVTQPIEVTDPPLLWVLDLVTTDVSCFGDSSGRAVVTPVGGIPPYTYSWSNGQTDSIVTGLSAGTYSVTVYDQNNCIVIPAVVISQPVDSVSTITEAISVSCRGGADGKAIVIATGGTPPYAYSWDAGTGGQITDTAIDLTAGSYHVVVMDSLGCTRDDSVFVPEPLNMLTAITDSIPVSCFGDSNGIGILLPSGGNPPYLIQWDVAANNQLGDTAFELPQGSYGVRITDSTGCVIDTTLSITQPSAPLFADIDFRAVACVGGNDGKAWVDISGGTSPYSIQWDSNAASQVNDTAFNLTAGPYAVTITDLNGCTKDTSIFVIEPAMPLTLDSASVQVSCNGGSDGKAIIMVSGGFTPYTYQWGPGAGSQTTDTAFNLATGTYMVVVSDSLGCVDNLAITVPEPDSLTVTLTANHLRCFNDSSGQARAVPAGGTLPYYYNWTTNTGTQITPLAVSLKAQQHFVTITDGEGCTVTDSIILTQPAEVLLVTSPIDTICPGDSTVLSAVASGGVSPYNYFWIPALGNATTHVVKPSVNTVYIVYAEDDVGCFSPTEAINIYLNDFSTDSIGVDYDGDICEGDSTLLHGFHNGSFGPYTYNWTSRGNFISNNAGPVKVTPPVSTTYVFSVTNGCGITMSDSLRVTVHPLARIQLPPLIAEGCVPLTVNFRNEAFNDTSGLIYLWEFGNGNASGTATPTHTYEEAGTYHVTLRLVTSEGCVSTSPMQSVVNAWPLPPIDISADPMVTDLRAPVVSFSSSTNNTSISWSFGDGGIDSIPDPVHTYEDTGVYRVTYIELNEYGCIDSAFLLIVVEPFYKLQIPNAFTPNPFAAGGGTYNMDDMNNDVFHPHTEGVLDYHLLIFNRWGELIFESFELEKGWDGYYRGEMCQQEVYVWKLMIIWENGQRFEGVGDVTLYR